MSRGTISCEPIRCVDLVIPEKCWEQKIKDAKKYQIDCFVMGDHWQGKFDFLKEHCQVIYMPRTPEISISKIEEYFYIIGKIPPKVN